MTAIPAPPRPDVGQLDQSLVRGVAWTGAAKWMSQLLSWATTLIVARLLSPADYGLVGMATVYLGLVTLVSEFGLGATVITLRDLTEEQVAQLNGLAIMVGVVSLALSCVVAVPLGRFFHAPQLPAVVVVMSSAFVITSFKTVPFSLLQRDMRFRSLALVEAAQGVLLAGTMITCALLGFRYWTLVIGGVLSSALSTMATLGLRRHRIAWPRRGSLADAMVFSGRLLVSRITWYVYSNADFLAAGRILGKTGLGLYNVGYTLANIPVDKMADLVNQVTPSVFSASQKDPAALRRYLLRITEAIALLALPACVGLALVAPDFVPLFLGPQWRDAVPALQLLALSAGFRAVFPLLAQVLVALGETRLVMRYSVLCAVVLPAGFFLLGTQWGTVGLALVWVVIFPLVVLPAYARALRRIDLSMKEYLRAMWPAGSATLFMAVSVIATGWMAGDGMARPFRFGLQIAVGVVAYGLACFICHRSRLEGFSRLLRALRPATAT